MTKKLSVSEYMILGFGFSFISIIFSAMIYGVFTKITFIEMITTIFFVSIGLIVCYIIGRFIDIIALKYLGDKWRK